MPNCIIVDNFYVLQYIIEPNNIVYFIYDTGDKLKCTKLKGSAQLFVSRDSALIKQDVIKAKFGLEFQVMEV